MNGLSTDQYISIGHGCPISTELDPVGGSVQVNIGSLLGSGDAVRLLMSDVDTCHRLAVAITEARNMLVSSACEGLPKSKSSDGRESPQP